MPSALRPLLLAASALGARALTPVTLGDCVLQRSIQTQLLYSAQLRNEPQVSWLSKFRDKEHLDSTGRHIGAAGLPQTYTPALNVLKEPWTQYLDVMGQTEDDVVMVEMAPPPQRLSTRQKANPFLMAQAQKSMFFEEPIQVRYILHRILTTADAICAAWTFHLGILEADDLTRVARDRMPVKGLPTASMRAADELREGGETAYTQGDDQMPLAVFDRRLCDRVVTLRALDALEAELAAMARDPDAEARVAETPYLRLEAVTEVRDDCEDERVLAKREKRRQRLEGAWVSGDGATRAAAAISAARGFVADFRAFWDPLVAHGGRLSELEKKARRRPGLKAPRRPGDGADADEVMEELWAYQDNYAYGGRVGGELVLPGALGLRLRELRAAECVRARNELAWEVGPLLHWTRKKYPEPVEALGAAMKSLTNSYTIAESTRNLDGSENVEAYGTA